MLAVIKGYVIVPWWAWTAAWLSASWSLLVFAAASRAEYRKYLISKQSASFIKDLMERVQQVAPESQVPMGPLFGSGDKPMN